MPGQRRSRGTPHGTGDVTTATADSSLAAAGATQSNSAIAEQLSGLRESVAGGLQAAGHFASTLLGFGQGDIQRDGTVTDPTSGGPVSIEKAMSEARETGATLGEWLMERYALHPSKPTPDDDTLRIFVPGLNTPEPEASRRTAYYAEHYEQPMVHVHNGTNLDESVAGSDMLDMAAAAMTRNTPRRTPLLDSLVTILNSALAGAEPQSVHAILYSDSTIAGTRAIGIVREQMIAARGDQDRESAEREVDALLREHLFVELHGNVSADLPVGPRYVAWTDEKDQMTHMQLPGGRELGFSGRQQDSDADVLYVDYDGPFAGGDAHNLQAVGVHAMRQTWEENGVTDSQSLFEKSKDGPITVPTDIQGDATELWNPENNR